MANCIDRPRQAKPGPARRKWKIAEGATPVSLRSLIVLGLLVLAIGLAADWAIAGSKKPPAPLDKAYLTNPANIENGKRVWEEQCRHCHGKAAYPGKAPKLKPRRYKADFVYDRVTNGFRKMPPWIDVYSDVERMAVVAYILSRKFSP